MPNYDLMKRALELDKRYLEADKLLTKLMRCNRNSSEWEALYDQWTRARARYEKLAIRPRKR